jgi:hypothetical protein
MAVCVDLVGCGDDPPGKVGELCVDERCEEGLYCAHGGNMAGRCTADCDTSGFCISHFGENTLCYASLHCAKMCSSDSQCQGGDCAELYGGDSVCLSQ